MKDALLRELILLTHDFEELLRQKRKYGDGKDVSWSEVAEAYYEIRNQRLVVDLIEAYESTLLQE